MRVGIENSGDGSDARPTPELAAMSVRELVVELAEVSTVLRTGGDVAAANGRLDEQQRHRLGVRATRLAEEIRRRRHGVGETF